MNPRAILPWILCAALLLGVGVWWSGGDRGAEGVRLPSAAVDAGDTGSQALPSTLHSAGSARSTAESDSRHAEPEDQPDADEDPAVETSPAGYLLVRVVQYSGQVPVAGAELTWMELPPEVLGRAHDIGQVEELLAEAGSSALTDASGSARLSWSRQRPLLVAARSGEQWGSAIERDLEAHQLSVPIAPDFHVDVLVRAAGGGAAAGVAVALRRGSAAWQGDLLRAVTDHEGRARLRHAGSTSALRMGVDEQRWIAAAIPLLEEVRVELDPAQPPREPVVLDLPPTGSVEILVRTHAGQPPPATVELGVRWDVQSSSPPSLGRHPPSARAPLEGSVARFPAVGLGLQLGAKVTVRGVQGSSDDPITGPRIAGEVVRAEVLLGSDRPLLLGRALDAAHAPLAGRELLARSVARPPEGTRRGWSGFSLKHLRTDDEGRFELYLDRDKQTEPGRTLTLLLAGAAELPIEADIDLSQSYAAGAHELGDVVLRPAPLLAAGRVVDGTGQPLMGARVSVAQVDTQDQREHRSRLGVEVTSGSEGRFELRTHVEATDIVVTASVLGRGEVELHCLKGALDLELVLQLPGSLVGRLVAHPSLARARPAVSLTVPANQTPAARSAHSRPPPRARSTSIQTDGTFELRDVPAGTYELRLLFLGETLLKLDNLTVPAGAACADPRLDPLELHGPRILNVKLMPSDPGEVLRGHYNWTSAGSDAWELRELSSPRFTLLCNGPIDISLHAFGHRAVHVEGLEDDLTVQLEPGLAVRLELPASLRLPEPPLFLKAALSSPDEKSSSAFYYQATGFDAQGAAILRAPRTGLQRVVLLLERSEPSGWSSWPITGPAQDLLVLDTYREQVFQLELSQATLDAALERTF